MAPGVSGNDELDEAIKELLVKQAKLDDWYCEMKVKEQTIAELKASSARMSTEIKEFRQRLSDGGGRSEPTGKVYEERDLAVAQVALEKQIVLHAKARLEQELVISRQPSDERAQLKESLSRAEDRIRYLESSDYQSVIIEKGRPAIIEEFRHSSLGKVEVALACKAGSDFIAKQLPAEYQDFPGRLQYPPSIAGQVDLLSRFEEVGVGYNIGEGEVEEEEGEAESSSDNSSGGADQEVGEGSKWEEE